ncbi:MULTISPECIES: PolC-type DNA polymerase III [Corynebacterium]|uniref:3'-5' exonuclease n=1 Tax=Corynebacterium TaxID=1716 RepID=UPI001E5EF6D2|nr:MULTISPECIES: 3'-5' exonuclease [Corynebacterium]
MSPTQQEIIQKLQSAKNNSVTIDIETTGLDPHSDRIIEIAATRIVNGRVTENFHTLVNPAVRLSPFITDLTGLSDGLLATAPRFEEITDELTAFLHLDTGTIGGTAPAEDFYPAQDSAIDTLVGHNVQFDYAFLQSELVRAALATDQAYRPYTPRLLCTAEAARALIPREKVGRYRLDRLAELLNTPHKPRHRAQADVAATIDLVAELSKLPIDV